MLLYSYFRTTKTDRPTVNVLFRMHFLFRYRYGIATLLMMTLLINSTGYAIAHSMVKRWSKASVRAYLLCHKPDTFFEFTLDNHSVVGYDNAEYLEEEQEIRIGEEMYDIFSSRLEQNGTIQFGVSMTVKRKCFDRYVMPYFNRMIVSYL
ncbi:MAG: hypothetical protein IPK11_15955 [Ignavibacteria bacterium]|nr:hypothetical protein [Ignavibacteria bacterium]